MAAYVRVPKDLSKVKNKIAFNLTKRQLICFGIGGAIGISLYSLVKDFLGISFAGLLMVGVMLPFFLLGTMEKNGLPLEKVLFYYVLQNYIFPAERPFATKNTYAHMRQEEREKKAVDHKTYRSNQKSIRRASSKKQGKAPIREGKR